LKHGGLAKLLPEMCHLAPLAQGLRVLYMGF
ncbi:MAG: hypothetical protein ACI8W3_000809, partial [Myxococcota bacterium]